MFLLGFKARCYVWKIVIHLVSYHVDDSIYQSINDVCCVNLDEVSTACPLISRMSARDCLYTVRINVFGFIKTISSLSLSVCLEESSFQTAGYYHKKPHTIDLDD